MLKVHIHAGAAGTASARAADGAPLPYISHFFRHAFTLPFLLSPPDKQLQKRMHACTCAHPAPAWMKEAMPVMARIITEIPGGSKVVVHCMGGLSRAGTFASIYLWMRGSEMEDAIATVRDIRSPNAINHRQVRFLMALANGHNGGLHDSEGSA